MMDAKVPAARTESILNMWRRTCGREPGAPGGPVVDAGWWRGRSSGPCFVLRGGFEQFEQFDEGDGCSGAIDLHAVRLAASRPTVQRCVPRSVPRTCSGERFTNHRFDGRGDLARLLRTGGLVAAEAARMGRATKRMFPGVGPRLRYLWATCRSSAPVNITVAKTRSEARSKGERSGWSLGIGEQYA